MRLILQVLGRLQSSYNEVEFTVDESESIKERLSSRALARKLGSSKIILLVPESLVTEIVTDENEAKELLSNRDELANRVYSKLRNGLLDDSDISVLIMQSVGTYHANGKFYINFLNAIDNIVVSLIFDLLERVQGEYEEIILDVSTGHNIYVTSLIDTVRNIIVYLKLEKIIKGERVPKFEIAYSPPVLSSSKDVCYPIKRYEFDVKAFFHLPIKKLEKLMKNY